MGVEKERGGREGRQKRRRRGEVERVIRYNTFAESLQKCVSVCLGGLDE